MMKMPKIHLGKWSVGLIVVFFLFFAIFNLLVASGQRGGATFFSNPLLSIPISLAGISGVSSFLTGIISIVKSKERPVFVFASTAIGLFILVFIAGEILFPH